MDIYLGYLSASWATTLCLNLITILTTQRQRH